MGNGRAPLFVLVQGCSCAGKTTFTTLLKKSLLGFRIASISLDCYYKEENFAYCEAGDYDFDNPAAFDWNSLRKTLDGYVNCDDVIRMFNYDYNTLQVDEYTVVNSRPELVVVEGLYSFNLFNRRIFNTDLMDVYRKPADNVTELVPNGDCYWQLETVRILLVIEKKVDLVWPAAQKWIYTDENRADVTVLGGSYNESATRSAIDVIRGKMIN